MLIEKGATNPENEKCIELFYENARMAMFDFVSVVAAELGFTSIVMPGYIGWSPKEGSGLFDPIKKISGLKRYYYLMNDDLTINYQDLVKTFDSAHKAIVLIVNYFGFRDPNYDFILQEIQERKGLILEDNAHGFFTYHNGAKMKSLPDATFFSLHKMFPLTRGGALRILSPDLKNKLYHGSESPIDFGNPYVFELNSISAIRLKNYQILSELIIKQNSKNFRMLFPISRLNGSIPQSLPVMIQTGNRNLVYEELNQKGFGVVSLYHTLIPELMDSRFSCCQNISACILNLPIHQDVNIEMYPELIKILDLSCSIL